MDIAVFICTLGVALLIAGRAHAWGAAGHAIVAEIAQRRLESGVMRRIGRLLGGNVSLAAVASWADTIQTERPETVNWHFTNIPVGAAGYDAARDCAQTPHGDCIVNALDRARATLADRRAPEAQRAEALKFVIHLVGDIHQPLHCATRNGDAGGATVPVRWFGKDMSLHIVWDVSIIERQTYDWGDHVARLERDWIAAGRLDHDQFGHDQFDHDQFGHDQLGHDQLGHDQLGHDQLGHDQLGTPADWAWQSHRAAVDAAYALPAETDLGDAYYALSRPVVERQLALAGVRLAQVLNRALSARPWSWGEIIASTRFTRATPRSPGKGGS
jgi:hypothetical protein